MKKALIILMTVLIGGIILPITSCSDKLDIQQAYEFTVTTMPVQKRIKKGETAEIRCQINRTGRYADAKYFLSYFQPDGVGLLRSEDLDAFAPNDLYKLEKDTFRLYYTSQSEDQQTINLSFYDNFKQRFELSLSFNNVNKEE